MSDDARRGAAPTPSEAPPLLHPADDFEAVYERYANFVWLTLQRLGVRRSDREDLCHDVFLVAYQKLPGYTERAAVRRWLFAICLRLAANYRRKAYVRFERSSDSLETDAVAPSVPRFAWPDEVAERREAFARAELVLERMQPLQRVVFVMYEIEGIACDEIASELAVPLGTVYSRLHAARKLFQTRAERLARGSKGARR